MAIILIVFVLVINSFVTNLKHAFSNIYTGYKKKISYKRYVNYKQIHSDNSCNDLPNKGETYVKKTYVIVIAFKPRSHFTGRRGTYVGEMQLVYRVM